MTTVKEMRIATIGRETTKGTSAAATRRLVSEVEITPDETINQPQPTIGILVENPTTDAISMRKANVSAKGDLNYQDIVYFLNMLLDTELTGTGTTEKVWTFAPTFAADPLLNSFTLRRRLTPPDTDEGLTYLLGESMSLSGAIGQNVKYDAKLWGRSVDRALAFGSAPAVPPVQFVAVSDVKLYIDDATFGATQELGTLVDWSLDIRGFYKPKYTQDGQADKSFSGHGLKRAGWDFKGNFEVDASTEAERGKAASRTLRKVRLEMTGPIISGSALPYKIVIDMPMRHRAGLYDQSGDNDGSDILPVDLIGVYDATALGIKVVVTNDLAAL